MAFNFKMPKSCLDCHNCGNRAVETVNGVTVHYHCDLIHQLFNVTYDILPNIVDDNCPYKNETFMKALTEISHRL